MFLDCNIVALSKPVKCVSGHKMLQWIANSIVINWQLSFITDSIRLVEIHKMVMPESGEGTGKFEDGTDETCLLVN